jgi:tetratricopeptide (TPR) repeat protein
MSRTTVARALIRGRTASALSALSATAVLGSAALGLGGCASSAEEPGELFYQAGDLRGAIAIWRAADAAAFAPRIAAVEAELVKRAAGYIVSARELEREGRLAESLLDYRLALELQPEDEENLAHVQVLAREVGAQRAVLLEDYRRVRTRGDLAAAEQALELLRRLDPFEPAYETEELRLRAVIAEEWRERRARARAQRTAQVESLVEAGRAAFGDEQLETALDLWRRALVIDPENERLQAYIARAERQLETLESLRAKDDGGA